MIYVLINWNYPFFLLYMFESYIIEMINTVSLFVLVRQLKAAMQQRKYRLLAPQAPQKQQHCNFPPSPAHSLLSHLTYCLILWFCVPGECFLLLFVLSNSSKALWWGFYRWVLPFRIYLFASSFLNFFKECKSRVHFLFNKLQWCVCPHGACQCVFVLFL